MANEFSRVKFEKLDIFVATNTFSRGWRLRAMPVDFSEKPCT